MKEKLNIAEVLRVGAILFIITAVSAALLAFVNSKTAPLIEKNSLEKEQTAMRSVMSDAAEFEPVDIALDDKIEKAFKALAADGETIGVCVITETTGYDVGIKTVVGIDADKTVTGIDIISMNETPGLGAKAAEEGFRSQYKGKSGEVGVSKSAPSDSEIQAISGATKTSNGVTEGVNIALAAADTILGGGGSNE